MKLYALTRLFGGLGPCVGEFTLDGYAGGVTHSPAKMQVQSINQ